MEEFFFPVKGAAASRLSTKRLKYFLEDCIISKERIERVWRKEFRVVVIAIGCLLKDQWFLILTDGIPRSCFDSVLILEGLCSSNTFL